MSGFSFRPATAEDLPALAECYPALLESYAAMGYSLPRPVDAGALWVESFQRSLGRFSQVILAEEAGRLAGFILCRVKRLPAHNGGQTVGEISDVWVDGDFRRRGLGEALCQQAIEWLNAQGVHSVEAQVLRDNAASQAMFEKLGFITEYRVVRRSAG